VGSIPTLWSVPSSEIWALSVIFLRQYLAASIKMHHPATLEASGGTARPFVVHLY